MKHLTKLKLFVTALLTAAILQGCGLLGNKNDLDPKEKYDQSESQKEDQGPPNRD